MHGLSPPRAPAAGIGGGGAQAPAPHLQPGPETGPVRADFTRQECAPPPPPRPVTTPQGGRPRTARTGLGRLPRSALGRGHSGAELDRGLTLDQRRPRPRAVHRRGAPLPRHFRIHFRPGEGRGGSGGPGRLGSEAGAAPALPLPGVASARPLPYLQLLRAAGAGGGPAGPSRGGGGAGGSMEEGPADAPRRLSAGAGGRRGGVPTAAFPSSSSAAQSQPPLPGTSAATAILPRPPCLRPRCPRPLRPPPRPPRRPRAYVMASRPPGRRGRLRVQPTARRRSPRAGAAGSLGVPERRPRSRSPGTGGCP